MTTLHLLILSSGEYEDRQEEPILSYEAEGGAEDAGRRFVVSIDMVRKAWKASGNSGFHFVKHDIIHEFLRTVRATLPLSDTEYNRLTEVSVMQMWSRDEDVSWLVCPIGVVPMAIK